MLDLAIRWNPAIGDLDLVLDRGELATDPTLASLVLVSLLTDRLADPSDTLPSGHPARTFAADRRGHWSDLPRSDAPSYPTPNLCGSRLWLLRRALATTETLRLAEAYAQEALAWMVEDGLAGSVTASATYTAIGVMSLRLTLVQQGAGHVWDLVWQQTAGVWQVITLN